MLKKLKNNHGFSLIEAVLALVMGAMVVGVTSETLVNNVDSYTFIANRKSALGDARYAINRISHELLRIDTPDIVGIHDTYMSFIDDTGSSTSFRLGTNGSGLGLFRGTDLLVDHVSSFTLTYYDANGNLVSADPANISQVKRIKVSITTEPVGNEGNITLSTVVTPRVFIGYSNYQ